MPIPTTNAWPAREAPTARKTRRMMTPRLGIVALPLFLAACGLPPVVTIASLAIDALSLAVTEKTITDHAISQIAQKDCAMWRGFTGKGLCIDEDSTLAVAAADGQATAGGADSADSVNADGTDAADLGAITTASGPTGDEFADLDMRGAESGLPGSVEPATPGAAVDAAGATETVDDAQPAPPADRGAPDREWVSAAMAGPGLYYVIGRASRWATAARMVARHGTLEPSVVTAKLDGRRVFRVVVGPFGRSEQKTIRRLIRRAGIYDPWAIRMNSAGWSVAKSTGTAKNPIHSVARLSNPSGF